MKSTEVFVIFTQKPLS